MSPRPRSSSPNPSSRFIPMVGLPAARPPASERRVAHRAPCRVRSLDLTAGSISAIGETVQLGQDGIVVQLGRWFEVGTQVELLLPHLDGDPACLYGVIVGARRAATGCFEISIALTPDEAVPAEALGAPRDFA